MFVRIARVVGGLLCSCMAVFSLMGLMLLPPSGVYFSFGLFAIFALAAVGVFAGMRWAVWLVGGITCLCLLVEWASLSAIYRPSSPLTASGKSTLTWMHGIWVGLWLLITFLSVVAASRRRARP